MIDLLVRNRKSTVPEADYVLDKLEKFLSLLEVLTPKFFGNWEIVLVEPKISEVKDLIDENTVPDYVNCHVMVSQAKLENIVMDYPKLNPKQKSVKELYKEMITQLTHLIDKNAMWILFDALNGDLDKLQESLIQLDNECEGTTITAKQVKTSFTYSKRVYASEVLIAFLTRNRYRWYKYNALVKELGEEIAYYALYKQVRLLLQDKDKYLHNYDVKNRMIDKIDAPFICYVYVLFANSTSWHNLYALLLSIDNRSQETLERIQNVNL